PAGLRLFKKIAERLEAVIRLAEIRLATLDGFFQYRSPDLAAVAAFGHQVFERLDGDLDPLGAARLDLCLAAGVFFLVAPARRGGFTRRAALLFGTLSFAHQVIIENELIAIGDQQIRGRALYPYPYHLPGVFAQFGYQGREVRIAADDH